MDSWDSQIHRVRTTCGPSPLPSALRLLQLDLPLQMGQLSPFTLPNQSRLAEPGFTVEQGRELGGAWVTSQSVCQAAVADRADWGDTRIVGTYVGLEVGHRAHRREAGGDPCPPRRLRCCASPYAAGPAVHTEIVRSLHTAWKRSRGSGQHKNKAAILINDERSLDYR